MNIRIGSVVMTVTIIATSSGCGTMKNFLFGRGARCGLCSSLGSCLPTPKLGNMMSAPCGTGLCPTAPVASPAYAPAPAYQAPTCNHGPVAGNPCECENYAGNHYGPDVYSSGTCGCGQHGETYMGESYSPAMSDPYMNSGQIIEGSIPNYGQEIPGGATYPLNAMPQGSYPNAPVGSDGFQARKVDSDGNKILWEEPLPAGARVQ